MSSGVTVSTSAKTVYEEMKKDKKYRYIVYHIKDEKVIDVESTGARNMTYGDMLNIIKGINDDVRYVAFDFRNEGSEDGTLILLSWCPEGAKVKRKMLYSSSFDALKKSLDGISKYIQAVDIAEASLEAVEEKIAAMKAGE